MLSVACILLMQNEGHEKYDPANKKILALSITLALSTNTYASPSDITRDKSHQDCPADLSVLSRVEIDALPAQCVNAEKKLD